jgi:hypothetical protein
MSKIDLSNPVAFYDDRNQGDVDFLMTKILYQDKKVCLCKAVPIARPNSQLAKELLEAEDKTHGNWWNEINPQTIFFEIKTGEVLHKEFDSWYATNNVTVNRRYKDITQEPILNK